MSAELDLSRYVELFRAEAREHLAELDAALGALERGEADASVPEVAAAFRAVHSVKGMAAVMGYDAVQATAHDLESSLDAVRAGDAPITPSLVARLFEQSDQLAADIDVAMRPRAPAAAVTDAGQVGGEEPGRPAVRPRRDERLVRVHAHRLDTLLDLAGELEVARTRLQSEAAAVGRETLDAVATQLTRLIAAVRDEVVTARMVPVAEVFDRFPRLVRDTARDLGKDVNFVLEGSDIEIDRSMLDRIGDPVVHLLRNAIDHGIEAPEVRARAGKPPRGRLTLSAQREASHVLLRVADDGGGVDRERVRARARADGITANDTGALSDADLLALLTRSGFSTAARVTSVSGRGVGLDVVDVAVSALGGTMELRSVTGEGTAITLRLPVTVAIVRALLARVAGEVIAIPFTHVVETVEVGLAPAADAPRTSNARVRGEPARVVSLRAALGLPPECARTAPGVTVDVRGTRATLLVDGFLGQQDVVVKRFDPPRDAPLIFGGAAILGDGLPALVVDVNRLLQFSSLSPQ